MKANHTSEHNTSKVSTLLKERTQTLYQVQQDLIKKVVPAVVQILKDTIAKDLLFVKGMKSF